MALYFALSDIHGYLEAMDDALTLVDLVSDKENKLILLGDYINYGNNSCKVLYKIKKLAEDYPNQAIILKGNHEMDLIEFLSADKDDFWNAAYLGSDKDFVTVNSFISVSSKETISQLNTNKDDYHDYLFRASTIIKEDILTNHKELVRWLKDLPLYFEGDKNIWVHAGLDENSGEYWKHGTSDEYFLSKFPATLGYFYKDIVSGHISTSSLRKYKNSHGIYWDGMSHIYIDGSVHKTGEIPVLKYNTITSKYSSFVKKAENGYIRWEEYTIK
jgi:serine/threonine protein phosphatase 1